MIIIKGLPLEITESDLDELFSKYGKIQKYEIQVSVQLDKNQELAVEELDRTKWREKYTLDLSASGVSNDSGSIPPLKPRSLKTQSIAPAPSDRCGQLGSGCEEE